MEFNEPATPPLPGQGEVLPAPDIGHTDGLDGAIPSPAAEKVAATDETEDYCDVTAPPDRGRPGVRFDAGTPSEPDLGEAALSSEVDRSPIEEVADTDAEAPDKLPGDDGIDPPEPPDKTALSPDPAEDPIEDDDGSDNVHEASDVPTRPERDDTIRNVTADSLNDDLNTKRLNIHPRFTEGLAEAIDEGDVGFFVAESTNGEPRGQVGVNWGPPNTPEIRETLGDVPGIVFMEVAESHRGIGIAGDLLDTVFDEAAARGHSGVFLTVSVENEVAQRVYERAGFEQTGLVVRSPQYNRDPDGHYGEATVTRAYVMYKNLERPA